MIKKFNEFDVNDYLGMKHLNEDVKVEDEFNQSNDDISETDVIDGQPVYENPYLAKISRIVLRMLNNANLGKFIINYNVVYIDGMPGVWIHGVDDNTKNIVCVRTTQEKRVMVFDKFSVGDQNTAKITYSTQILGFKNILEQLIKDFNSNEINESLLGPTGSQKWVQKDADGYNRLTEDDLRYLNEIIVENPAASDQQSVFQTNYINQDQCALDIADHYSQGRKFVPKNGVVILEITRYLRKYISTGSSGRSDVDAVIVSGEFDNPLNILKTFGIKKSGVQKTLGGTCNASLDEMGTDDDLIKREEARQNELKEDIADYEKKLQKMEYITNAMCHYVKQNGKLDNDDKSILKGFRGYFVTGKGGIGKSYTIKDVLKKNNMVLDRDYVEVTCGSTTTESIYNYLYQYNDKLIIFDDSPDLFSTPKKVSIWKIALQSEKSEMPLTYPIGKTNIDDTKYLYKTGNLSRQDRYFKEMGKKSRDEKKAYYEKRRKALAKELGINYSTSNADLIIKDEWKEIEAETTPLIPDKFVFNGLVIIIGNDPREYFKKELGDQQWGAIIDRFLQSDITPKSESVWAVIKKRILNEYADESIPDDLCMIPRNMTEEFVAEVDSLIAQQQYKIITWRIIDGYHVALRGKYGLMNWKDDLRNDMDINK